MDDPFKVTPEELMMLIAQQAIKIAKLEAQLIQLYMNKPVVKDDIGVKLNKKG